MPEKTRQIKKIDSRRLPVRLALVAVILFALAFGWLAASWQIGNMLAGSTASTDPSARQAALAAKSFAPRDPMTSWLLATAGNDVFEPGSAERALEDTKETVRLAPYDFRWWVELGRAYEQTEQPEKAEQSYLRGVELAPTYTYPHWQLGNFYLRQNRSDEAFRELQKAAAGNDVYRQQVFSIAWDFYEKDTARLESIAGELPEAKAGLARFYAVKGQAEDSLRVWNTLSPEEKQKDDAVARLVARVLYDKLYWRSAIQFVDQIGIEPGVKAETIQNGGFEGKIDELENVYFGWKVGRTEKISVKIDPARPHSGERSLRVTFNSFSAPQLSEITQVIVTEPSKKYRVSFWLKTEDLKSAGPPTLEVVNLKTSSVIVASPAFPVGTNDWQEIAFDFTAPADAEGVYIRTSRAFCGDGCPIIGKIWYDDFTLTSN